MESGLTAAEYENELWSAVSYLRAHLGEAPQTAWVLGSGLSGFDSDRPPLHELGFSEIPGFPSVSVPGHHGSLVVMNQADLKVCCLQGRVHLYEGLPLSRVVFPVRALALWGVQDFVLTNAAGAINADFLPGDLMVIRDHLNFQGDNPLGGPHISILGERFPDMTEVYDRCLIEIANRAAEQLRQTLRQGIYLAVKGPSYETPAEIRMFRLWGADAVGMSTVPEAIALRQMGKRILGISCITNLAAGTLSCRLDHGEVLAVGRKLQSRLKDLLVAVSRAAGAAQTGDGS
jgi:purine-nucleoside phosphorylase